jgi:16S rRNA (guanine527-N7)-methyltransferase
MRDFSERYLSLISTEFSSLNLTRITTSEDFYNKQIIDSVKPLDFKFIKDLIVDCGFCIDVGFGGGFPLLPLAHELPRSKFVGLEARRKKSDAVRTIANRLDLPNVQTFHRRVEEIQFNKNVVITFKAVGKIKDFLDRISYNKNCHVIFYKGPNVDELEGSIDHYKSFRLVFREKYDIEGTDGRTVLVYKGSNVPRGTKKDLVKLTDL